MRAPISGRERRFQARMNHHISKTIVSRAKATHSAIARPDRYPGRAVGQSVGVSIVGRLPICGAGSSLGDANWDGADVIALLGAAVNQSQGLWLACQLLDS